MSAYPKMKPAIKRRWVKALRSGKYKQGEGRLRTDDKKYCCLGVLCSISKKPYTGKMSWLPRATDAWCDLDRRTQKRLATMNDRGLSFSDIAAWIEKYL